MTLGPSLLLLGCMERWDGRLNTFLGVFGRVPLFFYLIHLPVVRLTGTLKNQLLYGQNIDLFSRRQPWPDAYTPKLWVVYLAWAGLVAICFYPACRWYSQLKRAHPNTWWARYL